MKNKDLKNLESQWKEMNHYLMNNKVSKQKRDVVFDRLVWLKKRIDNCKETVDYTPILYYFNETVFFFNKELKLEDKEKFKEM
jgi:hypothetical protein